MGVGRKEREDTVRAAATRPEEQPVMNLTGESSIVVAGDIAGKISWN
jgi:hypothetical protein